MHFIHSAVWNHPRPSVDSWTDVENALKSSYSLGSSSVVRSGLPGPLGYGLVGLLKGSEPCAGQSPRV